MKLLFVVQAYGAEVFGGAESHCRMMATRMAERGHDVHVATSCAQHYTDWSNRYAPGESELEGVTLHRFAVDVERDVRRFGPLSGRVLTGHRPVPLFLQDWWIDTAGPHLPKLPRWLWENGPSYDAVIFFTYLYFPTVRGLPLIAGRVPTILHPLAHDERPLYVPAYDHVLRLPDAFAFSVEEDAALVHRRFHLADVPQEVIGIGVDLDVSASGERFRQSYGLGDDPYLVSVGRLDPHKGSEDLYDLFVNYKARNPGPLKLVLVGEPVHAPPPHDDIVVTGFVDRSVRDDAIAGAAASVHPSYFESFSMALAEAWAQGKPAIVNGRCEVFDGQARRSGGALPYENFGEFEAAVDLVLYEQGLADRLGAAGRSYVEDRYRWDHVMDCYERFVANVASADAATGRQATT